MVELGCCNVSLSISIYFILAIYCLVINIPIIIFRYLDYGANHPHLAKY